MKITNVSFRGITGPTWARLITLIVLTVNQVAITFYDTKLLPFEDAEIYEGVSTALFVIATALSAYKNNSITAEAQEADKVLRKLKGGE